MFNLPNCITSLRLLLSPVFIALFLVERPWGAVGALCVAVLFEITDLLDGFVARRYDMSSSLGKLLDPLADSVSRLSVFLALVTERSVRGQPWPVLMVAALFYRDALVAYVRTFAASSGKILAARFSGKLKAVFQGGGILIFLSVRTLAFYHEPLRAHLCAVFYAVMIPIMIVTLFSAFDYLSSSWHAIEAIAAEGQPRQ